MQFLQHESIGDTEKSTLDDTFVFEIKEIIDLKKSANLQLIVLGRFVIASFSGESSATQLKEFREYTVESKFVSSWILACCNGCPKTFPSDRWLKIVIKTLGKMTKPD